MLADRVPMVRVFAHLPHHCHLGHPGHREATGLRLHLVALVREHEENVVFVIRVRPLGRWQS